MNTEKRYSRLVFEKDEYMITLCEYFDQHRDDEFYRDVVKFIESKFSIENDVRMNTLYRAFHDQHDYLSQLTDIESNSLRIISTNTGTRHSKTSGLDFIHWEKSIKESQVY